MLSAAKYCSNACRSAHWRQRTRIRRHFARKPRCTTCHKPLPLALRTDAHFCSPACRQAAYRSRKANRPPKAHQRRVKDGLANDGAAHDLDIRRTEVRPITTADAKALIAPLELLRAMPAVPRYAFGIFFDGRLAGAVVYGDEAAAIYGCGNATDSAAKSSRSTVVPVCHGRISASKLIRRSVALLPSRYKVITATVDGTVGEIGTVYQACGFDYVGTMRAGGRTRVVINGTQISERQAGRIAGTRGARALAQLGFYAAPAPRIARYFAFRGSRRECRQLRAAIAHLIKPYPKHSAAAVAPFQNSIDEQTKRF